MGGAGGGILPSPLSFFLSHRVLIYPGPITACLLPGGLYKTHLEIAGIEDSPVAH
jgi:hypothetical protein